MASVARRTTAVRSWTFLTNHAHVLLCVARDPRSRVQDLAERVGITYRAVQKILADLEEAGYLSHRRDAEDARANVYTVHRTLPLRHPVERHRSIAALLALILGDEVPAPAAPRAKRPR